MGKGVGRSGCFSVLLAVLGAALALMAIHYFETNRQWSRLAQRMDGAGPLRPSFLRIPRDCRPPTPAELRLDRAMVKAVRAVDDVNVKEVNAVHRYAVSYFAWHWRLVAGNRCPPATALVRELAPLLDRAGWPEMAELNDLRLAERLPPSAVRARGLARIAFLPHIPPSELNGEDSRPYARQLLGDQGRFAAPWARAALSRIRGDTRLGTGAAYLAVATDPAAALPKVQQVMADMLRTARGRTVQAYRSGGEVASLGPADADRLIELGYALARAGKEAEPFAGPILDILDDTVARPMPPFGLSATRPTEFCRIANSIGGRIAAVARRRDFCAAGYKGGDGSPREF